MSFKFLQRSEWGAREPVRVTPASPSVRPTAHWPAWPKPRLVDSVMAPGQLRIIQDFHMDERGWSDIGYNWAFDMEGVVWECRGDGVRPAAQNPGNDESEGCLFLVGAGEMPSDAMVEAGRRFLDWRGYDNFFPHSHWQNKECPGPALSRIIANGWSKEPIVNEIMEWQDFLNGTGLVDPMLLVDGDFGPKTLAASKLVANQAGSGGGLTVSSLPFTLTIE